MTDPTTAAPPVPALASFGLPAARPPAVPPEPTVAPNETPALGVQAVPLVVAGSGATGLPTRPPPVDPGASTVPRMALDDLLVHVLDTGGSDLHLTVGAPPTARVHGEMEPIQGFPVLVPQVLRESLYGCVFTRLSPVCSSAFVAPPFSKFLPVKS